MKSILTIRQVARLLGIPHQTVKQWSKDGIIKPQATTPSGEERFGLDYIARFLATQKTIGDNERENTSIQS